jgi:PKD repeat protein
VSAKSFLYKQKLKPKLIGMNDKKTLLTLISLLLVAMPRLTLILSVAEEPLERVVGVKEGDWVKYGDFIATYESDDPSAQTPPADLIEHNNTEWVKNTVEGINGTKITFQTVTHCKNGTETTDSLYVDISTGEGLGIFMFISANLSQGETIYGSNEYNTTYINATKQQVYANAMRETNYLVLATMSQYQTDDTIETYGFMVEYFWDKATGISSERIGTFTKETEEYSTVAVRSETVTDTNVWNEIPDTTPPTAEAGPNQKTTVNQEVTFNGGGSSDNEGGWGIASYDWDFGDGTQGTGVTVTHAFNASGMYTVTLTVKDGAGNSDEDILNVTVEETSSPSYIMGVVVLAILLIAGLVLWILKTKR